MAIKKKKPVEIDESLGLIEKLKSMAPTGPSAYTWEISSTKDLVLSAVKYAIHTGIDAFDGIVGGMPVGRMIELYGLESCIDGDTFIQYTVVDENGRAQNTKGGSIAHLWRRFNGVHTPGKGYYQREQTVTSSFYLPSVNNEDRVFRNKIADVVKTGFKECFKVTTRSGATIRTTADHKFYTGAAYVPLSDLIVGSLVMRHSNTPYTGGSAHGRYHEVDLKYYYRGMPREINGSMYYRAHAHRLAYEGSLNGLSLEQYRELLNSGITKLPDDFITLPEGAEIHHIDENKAHNDIDNLELYLDVGEHHRMHALKNHNDLRFVAVPDVIESIEPAGLLETYDIKCFAPNNNYVAGGFVVHNCGKTAMAIRCAVRAMTKQFVEIVYNQDQTVTYRPMAPEESKVVVVYIDNEQSLDEDGKLMVGDQKLDVIGCRFDTTDDVFKAIDASIEYQKKRMAEEAEDGIKRFMLIVVDTIASTSTKEEMDAAWGKQDYPRQALQISKALRQLTRRVNRYNICMLFTNQVRSNFKAQPGGGNVMAIKADDYTSAGGFALRFYASHRVFMYAMQQKYKLIPDAQFAAGLLVGFHTKKNRIKPPLRDGRMVLLFDKKQGGLNDLFSKLETLCFLSFIEVTAEKEHTGFTLKFKKNGIVPTTFAAASTETSFDEDEETPVARRKGSRKDPSFQTRSEWPQFYAAHKADIDVLWDAAMVYAMATEGLEGSVKVVEDTTLPPDGTQLLEQD